MLRLNLTWLGMALLLVACAGCGGATPAKRDKEISHVGAIATLYFRAKSTLGKPPASEQEFKDVIAQDNVDPGVLGVGSVDDLFVSDRDGQPLVVAYGQTSPQGVVVYEQVGKDGVRLVGFTSGQIEEADAAKFAQLVPKPATP